MGNVAGKKVFVVGSGIAGMAAAFELQKRGFQVTILERGKEQDFGGKMGNHPCTQCGGRHEHTVHIYMNWYHNFWRLAQELGLDLEEDFEPRESVNYLRSTKGFPPDATFEERNGSITNEGSVWYALENIMNGPEAPPDMFLYGYSLLDLISQPYRRRGILDNYGVNAFMRSRWYATPEAATLHHRFLNVAFANASFQTSGEAYKNFIRFSAQHPEPQYHVMKNGVRATFVNSLKSELLTESHDPARFPATICPGHTVEKIVLEDRKGKNGDKEKIVTKLVVKKEKGREKSPEEIEIPVGHDDFLVLAVPIKGMQALVDEDLYNAVPELRRVHSLRSQTIASLEVSYQEQVEGIPAEHTALVDSPHHLSFFDRSQVGDPGGGPAKGPTQLSVSVSEFDALDAWEPPSDTEEAAWEGVKKMLFRELREYMPNFPEPGKKDTVCLVRHTGAGLFVDDVHDLKWRPKPVCADVRNLFLAGEFVQNPIDVVTVEAAVVTGLQAADAILSSCEAANRIEVLEPEGFPEMWAAAGTALLFPYALAAKTLSLGTKAMENPVEAFAEGLNSWNRGTLAFWKTLWNWP